MHRSIQASIAAAAVTSLVALAPIVTHATAPDAPAACASAQAQVEHDRTAVDRAIKKLVTARGRTDRTRHQHRSTDVHHARADLRRAQSALVTSEQAVTTCAVTHQPTPTPTATVTTSATATATPAPLVFNQGTARLNETEPDLSSIPAISFWDGVPIGGTGFGSAWTADPSHPGYFYGLTDRGPNVTAPDGSAKLEPMAGFQDQIGYFHQVDGTLELIRTIGLTLPSGIAMSGLVNTEADTGEAILDQYGNTLPKAVSGLDSEGLVALADGTFWVSDEYGPFVVHFDANGKEIERFDPYQTATGTSATFGDTAYPLPVELRRRKANKGMEGLTVTSDGRYLVGAMQSPLDKNGSTNAASGKGAILRIVTMSLSDHSVREYLYSLHAAAGNSAGEAVSEITAVPGSSTQFIVDERDGKPEGTADGAVKNLWKIDLASATDVGPSSPLIGTTASGGAVTYDAASGSGTGLQVDGRTIEDIAGAQAPAAAVASLQSDGITTGSESLFLDYAALLSAIDPGGRYFGHDKVEGVAFDPADPNLLYLSNDSDFGITDLKAGSNPSPTNGDTRARGTNAEKFLTDDTTQDFGEVLEVDMTKVPAGYRA